MKRIKYLLFLLLCVPFGVTATSIESIDMDIVLDENGNATVTETWEANVNQGTEGYHPYFNLQDSELTVVSASMDNKEYTIENYWKESSGLSDKAYKAGIYKVNSNETDVVFGITSYGKHTYKIVYKITNFVKGLTDSDLIYWQLFPYDFSAEPDNVTIKVSGPYEYPDDLDVWGYGMYGAPCYVKDGAIYMTSDGPISSSDYLVLLAKFPQGKFNTNTKLDHNFSYYHSMAEKGAEHYNPNKVTFADIIGYIITAIGMLFPFILTAIAIYFGNKNNYGYEGNKTIDKKNVPMFREIPCNKDIHYANALMKLNQFGYKEANILGAIILKWVREDKIRLINEQKGIFNKNTSSIDLTKDVTFDYRDEEDLFYLMRAASGDGILEAKELERWARNHYTKYLNIFNNLVTHHIESLRTAGHIHTRKSKEECKQKNVMDDTIYKDSSELYGLKKFLENFSRIEEKEAIEVKVWDEYLMFAYLFGIADKVAKQLKNLYPEYVKSLEDRGLDMGTLMFIDHISTTSVNAASAAKAAAESYSSGGGGFSSGGGGGGSFGGGGGGGGFR